MLSLYKTLFFFVLFHLFLVSCNNHNTAFKDSFLSQIDYLVKSNTQHSFNGVVLIQQKDSILYSITKGYANLEVKDTLSLHDQFVIGSISKQITAVLILQAYEKGLLYLDQTISHYLPELKMPWKDSISVHHLLTHQHGIQSLNTQLKFSPGSQFDYSQLGYDLLAQILEQIHQQPFSKISNDLFKKHKFTQTFHPASKEHENLVLGYSENDQGKLIYELNTFENYTAAGGFISNAQDLAQWNVLLHNGSLLKDSSLELMCKKYTTREHPIFGTIDYGYGLTFNTNESNFQIGALGFAPGFVSSNFYFPKKGISVVVLENTAVNLHDFKKTFYYHTSIINLFRKEYKKE